MSLPRIGLLLDTTALHRYAGWDMHTIEPMQEAVEDGSLIGIPVASLVEARASLDADGRARLDNLVAQDATEVLDVIAGDWHELSYWRDTTGSLERAAAALTAVQLDAPVLTTNPGAYGDFTPVIELPA